jgi:photosystem I subunit 3
VSLCSQRRHRFGLVWLGYRKYSCCKYNENPAESEIIINVPLALKIMTTGYIWPISAWQELMVVI